MNMSLKIKINRFFEKMNESLAKIEEKNTIFQKKKNFLRNLQMNF